MWNMGQNETSLYFCMKQVRNFENAVLILDIKLLDKMPSYQFHDKISRTKLQYSPFDYGNLSQSLNSKLCPRKFILG
jgi:hypothetical protein